MAFALSSLARKFDAYVSLTLAEIAALQAAQSAPFMIARGKDFFHEGQLGEKVFILRSGWASTYKDLADGTRQIMGFPIPGDCVGLRGVMLKVLDHSCAAYTDAEVTTIAFADLMQLFDGFPRVRDAFMWSAARDEAMAVEHLVDVGRRSAIERLAHFFMELSDRLTVVGLGSKSEFPCPLNQFALADVMGLSAIHVNRVLRVLRERGLLMFRAHTVSILDAEGLSELANYRPLESRRRRTDGD